jgi:hypothetical protein
MGPICLIKLIGEANLQNITTPREGSGEVDTMAFSSRKIFSGYLCKAFRCFLEKTTGHLFFCVVYYCSRHNIQSHTVDRGSMLVVEHHDTLFFWKKYNNYIHNTYIICNKVYNGVMMYVDKF